MTAPQFTEDEMAAIEVTRQRLADEVRARYGAHRAAELEDQIQQLAQDLVRVESYVLDDGMHPAFFSNQKD